MKLKGLTFCCFIFLFTVISCDKGTDVDGVGACNSSFDQKKMYANLVDNLIIPAYASLEDELNLLLNGVEAFLENPNEANLQSTQDQFVLAYLAWQTAAPYEFGPAEDDFLQANFNNFPVNVNQLEISITSGVHNFDKIDSYDKGFPALDYLLFGLGDNRQAIVDEYLEQDENLNRRAYLKLVLDEMMSRLTSTLKAWEGDYKYNFVDNLGTADGSALSLLVNAFNQNYELVKRDKIGIPAGIYTLNIPNPDRVEAYYSQISLGLAKKSVEVSRDFYNGMFPVSVNGFGFDDYLLDINARKGEESLNDLIQTQFNTILSELDKVTAPLSASVGASDTSPQLQSVYNELSRQVVYIKTDMPANLCVSITYVDNPSDSD